METFILKKLVLLHEIITTLIMAPDNGIKAELWLIYRKDKASNKFVSINIPNSYIDKILEILLFFSDKIVVAFVIL